MSDQSRSKFERRLFLVLVATAFVVDAGATEIKCPGPDCPSAKPMEEKDFKARESKEKREMHRKSEPKKPAAKPEKKGKAQEEPKAKKKVEDKK